MNAQKYAELYAEAGYPVLLVWPLHKGKCTCSPTSTSRDPLTGECKTPGKHPMQSGWERRATTDVETIRKWFNKHPDAWVGIMPPKGHCIIDIDPRNGGVETIRGLLGDKKIKRTVIQRSGGGGLHLFYEGEPTGSLGKGVDVKRNGRGYVVAAPAGHVSGGKYSWRNAPWDVDVAPLPKELGRIKQNPGNDGSEESLYKDGAPPAPIPVKQMREALAHINANDYHRWISIGHALKHAYGDEGEELWLDWSKTSSKYEKGDEAKWETLDHNRDRPLITIRSIMSAARKGGYRPLAAEFDKTLWSMGDITEYLHGEPPAIDWVYEPCMPAGKVCLLAGAGGSSKSYLTLTLSMHLACALPLGPFKPAKVGKALMLVAEESADDLHRRVSNINHSRMFAEDQLEAIGENVGVVPVRGLDWRFMSYDEAGNLQETDRVDYLIDEVRSLGDVRLLVLDPLVAFNGANENDNAEMARLMFTLDRVAERTGAAVVIIHHVSKGGQVASLNDATQSIVRGASALVDNARSCILLTRMPRQDAPLFNINADDAGRFVVARVVKNNYGPHVPDAVFAVERGGVLRHAPEIQQEYRSLGEAQRNRQEIGLPREVLKAMIEHPEASQRELATRVRMHKSRVGELQIQLSRDNYLKRTGEGRNARYSVTTAGREWLSRGREEMP